MASRRRLILFGVLLGAPLLLTAILALYLNFADLSGWRDTVARLASDAIGRDLRIDGEFQPEIGFTTRVVATDITLANPDWSDDPHMVAVDRLDASIDLLSIISGPITIRDVVITGARLRFETDTEGRFNWALGDGEPSEASDGELEMVIGHALVEDLRLVYATPEKEPLQAELEQLEFTDDGTGMLDFATGGTLEGSLVQVSGRLGPLNGLVNAATVTCDLSGRLGGIEFSTAGNVQELASLGGADLVARIHGDNLDSLTPLVDLPAVPSGALRADFEIRSAGASSNFDLQASLGEITAHLAGRLDSLVRPESLDVEIDVDGPDVRAIAGLAGIDDLPPQPFSVKGRIAWEGFPITFDDVAIRVGPNSLETHGVLGRPPAMLGTDLRFDGEGPDVSALAAVAGIRMPRDDYAVHGRLIRIEHGVRAEEIEIRLGRSTVSAHGMVGDPPEYSGTSLQLEASIHRPDRYGDLVGSPLPEETLEITGGFTEGDGTIDLEGVVARLGSHQVRVDGRVTTDHDLVGSDLDVRASGPDFSWPAGFAGLDDAPAVQYEITGGLRVRSGGLDLHDVAAKVGDVEATATGRISLRPDLLGTTLDFSGSGRDLGDLVWLTGLDTLPGGDFEVAGTISVGERGYELVGTTIRVGTITAAADGVVTNALGLEGTDLTIDISGHELSALGPLLEQPGLPSAPFQLAGDLLILENGFELDTVRGEVEGSRVNLTGIVRATPGLTGTDLEISVDVPDLQHLGRLAAAITALPSLPAEPLVVQTRLAIDARGYLLDGFEGSLGRAEFSADGRVGLLPSLVGTDLTIEADGPDASLVKAIAGLEIPVAPFQVRGRLERLETSIRFHRLTARLGEHRASVDGSLGEFPRFVGTDLEIHVSGPDTNLYEALAGIPDLPDKPFALDGSFSGTPERFSSRDFSLTFGASDLQGFFSVDITGKPTVEAHLDSHILDLSQLRERLETAEHATHENAKTATKKKQKGAFLFPDEPMSLEWLQAADAEVTVRIDHLLLRANRLRDLTVEVHLEDGRLAINRMTAAGRGEGRMSGTLLLEPSDELHRLDAEISIRRIRLDPPDAVTQLQERPPIDIDIDLEAVGGTPHQLASSTNGAVQLVIGKGVFESSLLDLVTADILLTLIKAFNPFVKEDPTTELECGVALLSFEDGIAKLKPMAFQSDKMTLLGEGRIDLETEDLNLRWVSKPRKGIGVSASVITNPYIKLGGTLAQPEIELKPLEAVTSTGVAVATMGISLVAKGMFDRITAEKKVCKKALEEIESMARDRDASSSEKR